MKYAQWKIEMRNNLEMLSEAALRMAKNENYNVPDINRLADYVKSVRMMYDNIKDVVE